MERKRRQPLKETLSVCCEPSTVAYRSTGSVPVPLRKGSAPATLRASLPATMKGPDRNYAMQMRLKMQHAKVESVEIKEETLEELIKQKMNFCDSRGQITIVGKTVKEEARVSRVRVQGKAKTSGKDVEKDMKRASMKERWGLGLQYKVCDYSLCLIVTKVIKGSPANKLGLEPGHRITRINGWEIEAMEPQAALSILMAGGYNIVLGWLEEKVTDESSSGWSDMGSF